MSELSTDQKRILCQLARVAWEKGSDREGWLESNPELSDSKVQASWRHYHQAQAVGKQSLRLCTQCDYLRLVAYWKKLAGDEAGAASAAARAELDTRKRAWHLLVQALKERDLKLSYAGAICRRQFRVGLEHATEKQLWNLLFTVKNRRKPAQTTKE